MVEKAVRFLTRKPQATVPEAMQVVQISEGNIAGPNIQKQILQCLPGRKKPTESLVVAAPVSSFACSPMTTLESDITNNEDLICLPPKHVRIRKTAPAAMKDHVKNLKQKCHFSTAHKLAAATMSNKEFEVFWQERERRLNEQITDQESLAPTEDKLVAALETSVNSTTEGTEGSL